MNKHCVVSRFHEDARQTLGVLKIFADSSKTKELFKCKTLELPWNGNQSRISCIPKGVYDCKFTRSPLFSKKKGADVFTYEILNVAGRGGIRIHSANYVRQLLGCIALGSEHKDIDIDGVTDVAHSGDTMRAFELLMNKENFVLEII